MTKIYRSLLTRFYYSVKPLIPPPVRWALRRYQAARIRSRTATIWPINESAGHTPRDWQGWPDGKKFAFILTHDVESQAGVDKVKALANLEMKFGLRSAFNFIPEGGYRVPDSLREWLISHGFEVGVHDLNHDGKLYQSRAGFNGKAKRINHYLQAWKATGFRSGFMLRKLEWLHDLNIDYECSTFDTDPFEPQPIGTATIFPFWVPRPCDTGQESGRKGYVELPYTLPQDSTLFLLLKEPTARIWEEKTRWIASHGGMVLMNVHPDYIDFEGDGGATEFPVSLYENFLHWVTEEFKQDAWRTLPVDVARHILDQQLDKIPVANPPLARLPLHHHIPGIKIWIDLENSLHLPFFLPIIRELRKLGHQLLLTARDHHQTTSFHSLDFRSIGRIHNRNLATKVCGLLIRSYQLARFAHEEKPTLALNLGSRSQNLSSKLLGS